MSKTILAETDGFTPVIDAVLKDVGLMPAVVFGRIWRFCQMQDGVCKASLERIGRDIGLDRSTILRQAKILCEAGYLRDMTPEARNVPHTYADTGKAAIRINVTVAHSNSLGESVAQDNATVAQGNKTVAQSHLKIVLKKDSKDRSTRGELTKTEIGQANAKVDAIIGNGRLARYDHRDKIPEVYLEYCDLYVELTGQKPTKRDVHDWIKEFSGWQAVGLQLAHIRAAFDRSNKGDGFLVTRPGSLTRVAMALKAKGNGRSGGLDQIILSPEELEEARAEMRNHVAGLRERGLA